MGSCAIGDMLVLSRNVKRFRSLQKFFLHYDIDTASIPFPKSAEREQYQYGGMMPRPLIDFTRFLNRMIRYHEYVLTGVSRFMGLCAGNAEFERVQLSKRFIHDIVSNCDSVMPLKDNRK